MESKSDLFDSLAQTGALRISAEGNNPHYTSRALKAYLGKPITVYGSIDDENVYRFDLDELTSSVVLTLDEEKLKPLVPRDALDGLKKTALYFPNVLRIEGKYKGETKSLIFSKVLRIESGKDSRKFYTNDEVGFVFMGGDDSCWMAIPKHSGKET
jgi:hypothetical protein